MRKSSREQKLILNEADSERVCVCECVCEGISFRMHFSHINFTITFWTNNQVASVWAGIEKCYLNAAADFHLWATKRGISLGSSGLLIVSWNQSEDSAKCVVCVNVSLRGQLYPTYLPPSPCRKIQNRHRNTTKNYQLLVLGMLMRERGSCTNRDRYGERGRVRKGSEREIGL